MDCLYIVIPSYNESANIESVINDWYPIVEHCGTTSRLVIFDGSSPDGTADIVRRMMETRPNLEIQVCPKCGHGATLQIAYRYALQQGATFVFQTDADGQTLPQEFWQFWDKRTEYDVQIGFRKQRQDGFSRWVITRTLRMVLFATFGVWITDANTPFRLMSQDCLSRHLERIPKDHNLSNVLLTVSFKKSKESIRFQKITFRQRQGGENSINLPQILKIGKQAIGDFVSLRGAL